MGAGPIRQFTKGKEIIHSTRNAFLSDKKEGTGAKVNKYTEMWQTANVGMFNLTFP